MRRLCHLLLICLAAIPANLTWADDHPDPLANQATVITQAGRVYRGWLDGFRDDRVRLRLPSGEGEAIYQFAPDEIRSLLFPHTEEADEAMIAAHISLTDDVMHALDQCWSLRAPFLPALDEENRKPLLVYAEALLDAGRPLEAVARARRLRGIELGPAETERMAVVILTGFEEAGLLEEAVVLAEEWCLAHDPSGPSALGWAVLARQALREARWEDALWLGLHPVAFGHDNHARDLAHCYSVAIAAALELGEAAEAVTLFNEMRRRGLDWPDDEPLVAEARGLIEAALAPPEEPDLVALPDEVAGPPVPDPWLTLEAIRRILAKP